MLFINNTSGHIIKFWKLLDKGNWKSIQYYYLLRENSLVELGDIYDKRNKIDEIDDIDDIRRFYVISDAKKASKKLNYIKHKLKTELKYMGLNGAVEKHLPTLVTDVVRINIVCSLSRKSTPVNKDELIEYASSSQYIKPDDLDSLIKQIRVHPSDSFRLISKSTSHDVRAFIYKSDGSKSRIQVRKSGVLICPPNNSTPADVIVQFPDKHRIRQKRSDAKNIKPDFIIGFTYVTSEIIT